MVAAAAAAMSALIYQGFKMAFAVLYPAYSSYKAVKSKSVREYVKWMMYWVVFAIFTFVETFADMFVAWIPFYFELKICFLLWLIMPATKGSSVLYRKAVHPQLVKREKDIDGFLTRTSDKGYSALIALGSRGFTFAANMVLSTAIKGQSKLADQLSRSFSVSDLSDTSRELEQFNRRESTASVDSDVLDSQPSSSVRRPSNFLTRDVSDSADDNDQNERDSPDVLGSTDSLDDSCFSSQSVPSSPSTAEDGMMANVLIDRYLRSASLDASRMNPGNWQPTPKIFAAAASSSSSRSKKK